jgi:hypothetical protein
MPSVPLSQIIDKMRKLIPIDIKGEKLKELYQLTIDQSNIF